jgi:hypothetical protein
MYALHHRPTGHRSDTRTMPRPLGKAHLVTSGRSTVTVATRGVVFVHSAPPALCPHVEWALAGQLGVRVSLDWIVQPAAPGTLRAELSWTGDAGTGARIVSALRGWALLRFEVTEEPTAGSEGTRYSVTPALGVFAATTGLHGDVLVPEDRLRSAVARALESGLPVTDAVDAVLGKAWDDELEPFRRAGEGAPVRWLHQVG